MAKVNWDTATPKQAADMRAFLGQNAKDAAKMGLTPGGDKDPDAKDPRTKKDKKGR